MSLISHFNTATSEDIYAGMGDSDLSRDKPFSQAQTQVNEIAQKILEPESRTESLQRCPLGIQVLQEGLESATLVFMRIMGNPAEVSKEQKQEFVKLAASLSSHQLSQIKDQPLQAALVVAKQFASEMQSTIKGADPSTPKGLECIRNLVAFSAVLNSASITANDYGGDNTWNAATIASNTSGAATLAFAMNTCATTLGIAVTATDVATLALRMTKYQTMRHSVGAIEKKLENSHLNALERRELELEKQTLTAEMKELRKEYFSASNLTDKFLSAGVNSTYFASNWMAFAGASQTAIAAVGAFAFGGLLAAQGVKGLYDDTKLWKANQREIKGLDQASNDLKTSQMPESFKTCAQNLIQLKMDHASHAEKNRRILSFVKNATVVLTGVASTGVLGGPIGLVVSLSLSLAVRFVQAVINNKPQIVSFFTSLPGLWGAAQDHPRNRAKAADKVMSDCSSQINSLKKQVQAHLVGGNLSQISHLQNRISQLTVTLHEAKQQKEVANMELNQAKLEYFISDENRGAAKALLGDFQQVLVKDSAAIDEFKNFVGTHLGVELSGSKEEMYNQMVAFILSPPDTNSTLAQLGAAASSGALSEKGSLLITDWEARA